ncbi:molybdenum ABC transporter ATP-binding protein ModC [Enterovibrio calviensis]|uniref:molybdenum ABC transporter ATP-binding protein ModC n=1 Tax=Enterovibrio calviensis TaxID=91359 RepID=UPI003735EA0A
MIALDVSLQREDFSLSLIASIPSTGITAVFGRSGAGKTSLINAISGLVTPDSGSIRIGSKVLFDGSAGVNLRPEQRRIGYVFQDARLFPHMSVAKNLNYGSKVPNSDKFNEVVSLLDIGALLSRYPNDLSGGEKQRVAIGRALLSDPEILIMDEPTASLDKPRRQELISYLLRLAQTLHVPVIYVSHSLDEILQLADHMLLLEKGEVIANGSLHDVWGSLPMRPWLAAKEQSALVTATVVGSHPVYAMTQLDLEGQPLWVTKVDENAGASLRLRIFANDISIAKTRSNDTSIRNVIPSVIQSIERAASLSSESGYCQLVLRVGNETLLANITQWALDELGLLEGQEVYAQLKGVSIARGDLAHDHRNN